MKKKDTLLLLILITYLTSIIYVYLNYSKKNHSLSNLLNDEKCNSIMFYAIIIMGYFTLLYEFERNH